MRRINSLQNRDDEMEIREKHYKQYLGQLNQVILHSTDVNEIVHIDVYQFSPTPQKPYWTLITGGMSDGPREMVIDRTEILMYAETPQAWMIDLLKKVAEMPFRNEGLLHWGQVCTPDINQFAGKSNFTRLLFVPPFREDRRFEPLRTNNDDVDFLWMIPITEPEYQYMVNSGTQSLFPEMLSQEKYPRVFSSN